jgi:hypothetical protein
VSHDSAEREKFQTKQLFDMLRELEDPRGGDRSYGLHRDEPEAALEDEAALRLAEIGDVRASPRSRGACEQDPLKLYNDVDDPELRRDDNERVVGARMLADLAILHPEKRDDLAQGRGRGPLLGHPGQAAAARQRAALPRAASARRRPAEAREVGRPEGQAPERGRAAAVPELGDGAERAPLPRLDEGPARLGDPSRSSSIGRNKKSTSRWEGLMQGGLAIVGMTIRALGVGASDGFAQWGDPRRTTILVKYIEDKMDNEQSRIEACFALSWVATDDEMKEVVKKVHDYNKPDPKSQVIRGATSRRSSTGRCPTRRRGSSIS